MDSWAARPSQASKQGWRERPQPQRGLKRGRPLPDQRISTPPTPLPRPIPRRPPQLTWRWMPLNSMSHSLGQLSRRWHFNSLGPHKHSSRHQHHSLLVESAARMRRSPRRRGSHVVAQRAGLALRGTWTRQAPPRGLESPPRLRLLGLPKQKAGP